MNITHLVQSYNVKGTYKCIKILKQKIKIEAEVIRNVYSNQKLTYLFLL